MAKKSFKSGLNALLGDTDTLVEDLEDSISEQKKHIAEEETNVPLETKATFVISIDQLEKLRAIAFWDRASIKEILSDALSKYFDGRDEEQIERAIKSFKEKKR
jgi:hypothetical protein